MGDQNHGVRHVDPLFVIAHEASPSGHPAEGAFDHPAARQDLEAFLVVAAAHDLDDEVEIAGFVNELEPVVGAIGIQLLDPWPALADAIQVKGAIRAHSSSVKSLG